MTDNIKIGILGCGNLGRGAELAIKKAPDMELAAVFTRREPKSVSILTEGVPVLPVHEARSWRGRLDVMILCGGSKADLPRQGPEYAELFSIVDSFDTHADIPEHYAQVEAAARRGGTCALISCGWDPGLFSLARAYAGAALPGGDCCTFWGRGVSQGHSDAIRQIEGVLDARQYTVPREAAVSAVREGRGAGLTARDKHTRECYVVAAPDADRERIAREIVTMPNYFDEYDTTVRFVSPEELRRKHGELPHGGRVMASGRTGAREEHTQRVEFTLELDSNPEFTSGVLVCCARAVHRLRARGVTGALTMLDIPPALLRPESGEWLRANLL